VLRIYFTDTDLARTSVASTADPFWEMVLSGFRLHESNRDLVFQPWIQRLRSNRRLAGPLRSGARILSALAPKGPYFPDFITPFEAREGLNSGLDAVLSTPRSELSAQLARLNAIAPIPQWIKPLADGDRESRALLRSGLTDYYKAAIEPYEDLIHGAIDADRTRRAHHFLDNGIEGMLAGIGPVMRWRPPVLEVDHAVEQDLHLRGRGLRLVPSFFCGRTACTLADPDFPPVLIYPIDLDCRWAQAASAGNHRSLDALIGTTRADILRAINLGATTTELARRVDTSPGSVSRHTSVLRQAGLITTQRDRNAMVHTLTRLGADLLGGR
jgi:DNA-binding transcriptional ArsR family regulator